MTRLELFVNKCEVFCEKNSPQRLLRAYFVLSRSFTSYLKVPKLVTRRPFCELPTATYRLTPVALMYVTQI